LLVERVLEQGRPVVRAAEAQGVSAATAYKSRYAEVLAELAAALVLWRRAEQVAPAGRGRSRNALACTCACGRRIRVARSLLELAPILCAGCTQPFQPEDDEER
jgi:leucine-zipper of insertion element IS481